MRCVELRVVDRPRAMAAVGLLRTTPSLIMIENVDFLSCSWISNVQRVVEPSSSGELLRVCAAEYIVDQQEWWAMTH